MLCCPKSTSDFWICLVKHQCLHIISSSSQQSCKASRKPYGSNALNPPGNEKRAMIFPKLPATHIRMTLLRVDITKRNNASIKILQNWWITSAMLFFMYFGFPMHFEFAIKLYRQYPQQPKRSRPLCSLCLNNSPQSRHGSSCNDRRMILTVHAQII